MPTVALDIKAREQVDQVAYAKMRGGGGGEREEIH